MSGSLEAEKIAPADCRRQCETRPVVGLRILFGVFDACGAPRLEGFQLFAMSPQWQKGARGSRGRRTLYFDFVGHFQAEIIQAIQTMEALQGRGQRGRQIVARASGRPRVSIKGRHGSQRPLCRLCVGIMWELWGYIDRRD